MYETSSSGDLPLAPYTWVFVGRSLNYINAMYLWRVLIFGKSPARSLGTIIAPDNEKAATAKAIDFFCIEEALQFRVVVEKLGRAKTKEPA
jgi:hypothetical protein